MALPDGKIWWCQDVDEKCYLCGADSKQTRLASVHGIFHQAPRADGIGYDEASVYFCQMCLRDMLWGLTVAITYKPSNWAMTRNTLEYWRDKAVPDNPLAPVQRSVDNCKKKMGEIMDLLTNHKRIEGKMIRAFKEDFDTFLDMINLWAKTL